MFGMIKLIPSQVWILIGACLLSFSMAWTIQGWRLNTKIADLKAEASTLASRQAKLSLDKTNEIADKINTSAKDYQKQKQELDIKFNNLKKEKNALKPIPVNCNLDDGRMFLLRNAVGIINHPSTGYSDKYAVPEIK